MWDFNEIKIKQRTFGIQREGLIKYLKGQISHKILFEEELQGPFFDDFEYKTIKIFYPDWEPGKHQWTNYYPLWPSTSGDVLDEFQMKIPPPIPPEKKHPSYLKLVKPQILEIKRSLKAQYSKLDKAQGQNKFWIFRFRTEYSFFAVDQWLIEVVFP